MSALSLLELGLMLLQMVLAQLTRANGPQVAIEALRRAIAEIEQVRGSEVTRQQLEGMRFTPQW